MTHEPNPPPLVLDVLSPGPGWTPPNPADLPFVVAIPRVASGLYWPILHVLRVSSRTMERPAAVAALTVATCPGSDKTRVGHGVRTPATLQWVVDDRPYTCPPLAASWARTGSARHGTGFIQLRWGLCTYRPQVRVNDGKWTWRRASLGTSRDGPLEVDDAMEIEGRAWAAAHGLAYLPGLCSGRPVDPAHVVACHAARASSILSTPTQDTP